MSGEGRSIWRAGRSAARRFRTPATKVVAVVGFVGACLGIYGFFVGSSTSTSVLSAEENRLLGEMPPKLGQYCAPYEPEFTKRYSSLVAASIECDPIDPGPDSVRFHLFTTPRNLDVFMDRQRDDMGREGAGCTSGDFGYSLPWVDARGRRIGELQCRDDSERSRLLWSYDDLRVVASAGSPPREAERLHAWWQRYVRFDGGNPPASFRQRLKELLPPSFDPCWRDPIILPMVLAGVFCDPGEGITAAGAELFADRTMLSDYIDRQADLSGIGDESCEETPFSYMDYGWAPDFRPTLGYLLCRPLDGSQWFEWSAERPRVYAYASRADNDFTRLYGQWAQSLSWIKGLRPPGSS